MSSTGFGLAVKVVGFNPCPKHYPVECSCEKPIVGTYENVTDLTTNVFAQWIQNQILGTPNTIKTTLGTSVAWGAFATTLSTTLLVAGTGTTAPAVTDTALTTPVTGSSGNVTAVINSVTGTGASGSFTVTGTILNYTGGTLSYSEVGILLQTLSGNYLLAHDTFSTLAVANGGGLNITYSAVWS
jgi:hypothetical protein